MTRIRADKVRGIASELPLLEVDEDDGAEVLVLGWGSSLGAIRAAARRVRRNGHAIAIAHLRHLHPLPTNLGEVLHRYERVLVPEMNTGQLAALLRAEFLVAVESYCKLEGKPLFAAELQHEIEARL
jgi:2-oxoglutarate ferredoxin oxidoreductase subunit alpha